MKASRVFLFVFLIAISLCSANSQPVKSQSSGTIYIRADGSVEGTNKIQRYGNVYTFTGNIYDSFVVERDNIVIDGAGFTLQGTGSGTGIWVLEKGNVTIANMRVEDFGLGICFSYVSGGKIIGNTVKENIKGIQVTCSSDVLLRDNVATGNVEGIAIDLSFGSLVLRGNVMVGNERNFVIYGMGATHFIHDIDVSNTVDGKPIYYWVNRRNMEVPSDAGYVALVNCTSITVQNLKLNGGGQGVVLASTTHSTITRNFIANNEHGIFLCESSNNTISENLVMDNNLGILLEHASNNSIVGNNITSNKAGIHFGSIVNRLNTIIGNMIANNEIGIYFEGHIPFRFFENNTIYHNSFINNTKQVYDIHWEEKASGSMYMLTTTIWDDGKKGNYWSNYNGTDKDGDGIGDISYVIDDNNKDRYPLMKPVVIPEFPDDEKPTIPTTEPFPTTIVAAIAITAIGGAALLVYFAKVKKTTGETNEHRW